MSDPAPGSTNVVIGAASGMGAATAALLAPRGRLLLADRDRDPLDAVAAGIRAQAGGEVETMTCDVTDLAQVEAVARAAGMLGALVHTAGLSPSMASGRPIFQVNLLGTAQVVRAFEAVITTGSVAVCFSSMSAYMAPSSPEIDAVLDDPESPTFFEDLAAREVDVDNPQLAYVLSKQGVQRIIQLRSGAWGARGRACCRCRPASSTRAWAGWRRPTSRPWPTWSRPARWAAPLDPTRWRRWPPS